MGRSKLCKNRSKLEALGTLWSSILIFTIAALIALLFSLLEKGVNLFQRDQLQNDDNNIGMSRAYFIGLWTVILSFITSTFRCWRSCIDDTLDNFFPMLLSANATSCFFSFILFFSTRVSIVLNLLNHF